MVDRAAIFAALTERNALRKAAQLPLIDVQAEYQEAVERALLQEWEEQHAEEIAAIWEEEKAKYRQEYGHEPYGLLHGGALVGSKANNRIAALRRADNVALPIPRHQIIYGSNRKESE